MAIVKKGSKFLPFLKDNWLLIFVIIYLFLPVDLIPDVIPILGKVDDAGLLVVELIRAYIDSKKEDEKK